MKSVLGVVDMPAKNMWNKLINVKFVAEIKGTQHDGVCIISESISELSKYKELNVFCALVLCFSRYHAGLDLGVTNSIPYTNRNKLIVYTSTGSTDGDFDDARKYLNAGIAAAKYALSAKLESLIFVVLPSSRFPNAQLLAIIGVLHALYVPLNLREAAGGFHKLKSIDVYLPGLDFKESQFLTIINAIQSAFQVCRDIGDSDPIRMAPPNVANYVEEYFANSKSVKVTVLDDKDVITKEYPLMAAVNRGADLVKSHQARLIWLEYFNNETPSDIEIDFETLFLIGKGVTLDTGGTDVKTGGAMFGMSRDKYGAAVLAGFFAALNTLKPKGLKVKGGMCMVRNSIGSNSYTCDEIIVSRSGKKIHIANTDAEGRIAMLDLLTHFREQAVGEKNPHLITLATLTGHCVLTYGHCSAIIDNGPARAARYAEKLQLTGDLFGQPVEISRLHKEDFDFHSSETEAADLRQANTKPSVQTMRGHISPAAFLIRGSRLDENGLNSTQPLQFTHIDIGTAMGLYPATTFPNPLLTLIAHHILKRIN